MANWVVYIMFLSLIIESKDYPLMEWADKGQGIKAQRSEHWGEENGI